jgi:NAD(P)-dependent dehydrogenase (short-subunit alcohol dehydrogenase family)
MSGRTKPGVAVVTGGTGALGQWVVELLLENGWAVHVPWLVADEAEALALRAGERAGALTLAEADVGDPASVERFFAGVREREGRLDVLCNLVGGFRMSALERTTPDVWEHLMRLNATSAFLCCRAAVPYMRESGGGRIVNVAALPAVERGARDMSAYAASKSAVLSLTYSLARELREAAITVNAVAPEVLDTPDNRRSMPDADPAGWVHPSEAAQVIAFLVGEHARVVSGNVLVLAGG